MTLHPTPGTAEKAWEILADSAPARRPLPVPACQLCSGPDRFGNYDPCDGCMDESAEVAA